MLRSLYRTLIGRTVYRLRYRPAGIVHLPLRSDGSEVGDCRKVVTPASGMKYSLYRVSGGRLDTDGNNNIAVMDSHNRVVSGASWQFRNGRILAPEENTICRRPHYVRPLRVNRGVYSLLTGGGGYYNYFHWLYDVLPRLHLLRLSEWESSVERYLLPCLQYPFQRETLDVLGIPVDRVIESSVHSHVWAGQLISSDHPRPEDEVPAWICEFLRNTFLPHEVSGRVAGKRVYLGRRGAANRRIVLNEPALMDALAVHGVSAVEPGELSFREQVGLSAGADLVISPHGAGLANMVFCKAGAVVVEICASDYQPRMYESIARTCKLNYLRITAQGEPGQHAQQQGMTVDVPGLLAAVMQPESRST